MGIFMIPLFNTDVYSVKCRGHTYGLNYGLFVQLEVLQVCH